MSVVLALAFLFADINLCTLAAKKRNQERAKSAFATYTEGSSQDGCDTEVYSLLRSKLLCMGADFRSPYRTRTEAGLMS